MNQASGTPANGHKVGYARVSTAEQNIGKIERSGWQQLMNHLREGDVLAITELSRMTRSLKHLLQVVEDLDNKGVDIVSIRQDIDTSTATGRCFVSIMGAISQMERELKSERAAAGREAAKARGKTEDQGWTQRSWNRLEFSMRTPSKRPQRSARRRA